ncbi:LapA family protein [Lampropedia puyangensis]|uniref:LapA family protein n=1 Tax=Lampropedia puyangensis TaxID=1330072 RepID=A0A4S8EVK2_9BURK|nr:LapA family protein [Lampropedia puyangensis]THT98488.1 LapA family protein [Lampropedia puyangensis]
MKYLIWLLRAAFFFLLFAFSLNNQHPVTVHWFFGMQWHGPMVLAMLVAFALGLAIGLATVIPRWRQLRNREAQMASAFQASAYTPTQQE